MLLAHSNNNIYVLEYVVKKFWNYLGPYFFKRTKNLDSKNLWRNILLERCLIQPYVACVINFNNY